MSALPAGASISGLVEFLDLRAHVVRTAGALFQLVQITQRGDDGRRRDGSRGIAGQHLCHIRIQLFSQRQHIFLGIRRSDDVIGTANFKLDLVCRHLV